MKKTSYLRTQQRSFLSGITAWDTFLPERSVPLQAWAFCLKHFLTARFRYAPVAYLVKPPGDFGRRPFRRCAKVLILSNSKWVKLRRLWCNLQREHQQQQQLSDQRLQQTTSQQMTHLWTSSSMSISPTMRYLQRYLQRETQDSCRLLSGAPHISDYPQSDSSRLNKSGNTTKKEFDHSTQASFETRLLIHFRDDQHVHAIIDSYVIKADIKSISLIAQRFLTGRFEHITKDGISHLRDNTAIIYDAFIETQWTGHSIPKANGFSQFETIEQDDSEPISFKANLFSKDDFRLRGADTASSAPDESLRSLH
jgi:hypothetical protein